MWILLSLLASLLVCNAEARLPHEFIVGGTPTAPAELKYQVSVQIFGESTCGGGIIDEQFILTAAHCIMDANNDFLSFLPTSIIAGVNDLNNPGADKVEINVTRVYVPAFYNGSSKTSQGDIAVLKLEKKLDLVNLTNLKALQLPEPTADNLTRANSYDTEKVLIAGFGWNEVEVISSKKGNKTKREEIGKSSGELLKAKALVLNNTVCQELYPKYKIAPSQICARIIQHPPEVHQGVCSGDSGGPLVYKGRTVIGVVSYNYLGCNDKRRPGVYTRVSSYIDFINNAMADNVTEDMRAENWSLSIDDGDEEFDEESTDLM